MQFSQIFTLLLSPIYAPLTLATDLDYMAYSLIFLFLLSFCTIQAQPDGGRSSDKRSLKIRKRLPTPAFATALSLPQTATSCDCPTDMGSSVLTKLGCQHPDTAAICKVVVTRFDIAILSEDEPPILIKNVRGSFLSEAALQYLKTYKPTSAFISYSNIQGMTGDGKMVVVPSFGTRDSRRRATRAYRSVYDFLPTIDTSSATVLSFELLAYDDQQQMIFKQRYDKANFDAHAIRPDAVRYVFRDVQAQHQTGFLIEVAPVQVESLDLDAVELLSATQ